MAQHTNSGFFDLSPNDLKDPTLTRLNGALKDISSKLNMLISPVNTQVNSYPTFRKAGASGQTDPAAIDDTEFITKGMADQLYGAGAVRQALLSGTTAQPTKNGFKQSQPLPSLISGNLLMASPWTNWTPSYSCSGLMTLASTSTDDAQFIQVGPMVFFKLQFSGTLAGILSGNVYASLPVALIGGETIVSAKLISPGGGGWDGAVCLVGKEDANHMAFRQDGGHDFTSGSWSFGVEGFYRTQ